MYRTVLALLVTASPAFAQIETVRFAESFAKDTQYHVDCRVEIFGSLPVPATEKDRNPKPLNVSGKSSIKYDERILSVINGRVDRTLRYYRQMDFERKVADQEQQNQLRPEVRRLVILRHKQYEVPFCPTGPLTVGEIELVRTDVFAPALTGLFPTAPATVGQSWKADDVAIQELTDLEKIDKAEFKCTFEKITTLLGRRYAHVTFDGNVWGVGEDGNARHEVRGAFHYDIDAGFLSHLSVKGAHHLLTKNGVANGKVEGTFVMTRTRTPFSKELTDDANRGLTLEPNAENSMLLLEHPRVGMKLLHSRNWRVGGMNETQIAIDENRGSGMLITLTPAASTPTGGQFYNETLAYLQKQQARVVPKEAPRVVQPGVETFVLEAEFGKQPVVVMRYYVVRQGNHGATIAVRMPAANVSVAQADVERMVRSLRLGGAK